MQDEQFKQTHRRLKKARATAFTGTMLIIPTFFLYSWFNMEKGSRAFFFVLGLFWAGAITVKLLDGAITRLNNKGFLWRSGG